MRRRRYSRVSVSSADTFRGLEELHFFLPRVSQRQGRVSTRARHREQEKGRDFRASVMRFLTKMESICMRNQWVYNGAGLTARGEKATGAKRRAKVRGQTGWLDVNSFWPLTAIKTAGRAPRSNFFLLPNAQPRDRQVKGAESKRGVTVKFFWFRLSRLTATPCLLLRSPPLCTDLIDDAFRHSQFDTWGWDASNGKVVRFRADTLTPHVGVMALRARVRCRLGSPSSLGRMLSDGAPFAILSTSRLQPLLSTSFPRSPRVSTLSFLKGFRGWLPISVGHLFQKGVSFAAPLTLFSSLLSPVSSLYP